MCELITSEAEVLLQAWRSLGLRAAELEWELEGEAWLRPPLAARLRGALGPALRELDGGAFAAIFETSPPPLWFVGWDAPKESSGRVAAELRCLGSLEPSWGMLATALSRMRFPGAGGLVGTRRLRLRWAGAAAESSADFGQPLAELPKLPELPSPDACCLVEAVAPLQVVQRGRVLLEAPSAQVLVRSAGERLRQLCVQWGVAEGVSTLVGRAVREAQAARLQWADPMIVRQRRLSSRTGAEQWIRGLCGQFAYADMPPLGMALLLLATELGLGKDTAFGCGTIRLLVQQAAEGARCT